MNKLEKRLLENIFDSLDRLFDRECKVIDLHALLFASDLALKQFNSRIHLADLINELDKILKRMNSDEEQRKRTLAVTDNLRNELNELLPVK